MITTDCPESIVLEQYSFDQKADFFEEVFGIRPVLRQKRGGIRMSDAVLKIRKNLKNYVNLN